METESVLEGPGDVRQFDPFDKSDLWITDDDEDEDESTETITREESEKDGDDDDIVCLDLD